MLQFTIGGSNPVVLPNGQRRAFLQDGDEISVRGTCGRPGYATIGFGSCSGRIEAAGIAGVAKKVLDADATALEPMKIEMECRALLVHAHLVLPELDPHEVLYGQLLTVMIALPGLLVLHLLAAFAHAAV